MIYLAGILEGHIVVDGENISFTPGGRLYETAVDLRRNVDARVGLLTKLANDGTGRMLIQSLVEEKIVFDPLLVDSSLASWLTVEDRDGRTVDYTSCSAVYAQTDEILESLRGNSDVDIVSLVGSALYHQPLFSSLIDAVTFLTPRPVLVVDLSSSTFSHPDNARLVRQVKSALEWADSLIIDKEDLSLFDCDIPTLARHVYFCDGDRLTVHEDGRGQEVSGGRREAYRRIILRSSASPSL